MRLKTVIFLALLLGSTLGPPARAAFPALDLPMVESVDGADSVEVLSAGKKLLVKAGETFSYGARIKTPQGVSAKVLYTDGSRLEISPGSDVQVEDRVDGVQWNRLHGGEVRGVVTKSPVTLKKPRFLIRTRTSVLGVRGTDFVMDFDAATQVSQVHTLEGTVEVARDEVSLMSGKGVAVGSGQAIQGSSSGLSDVQEFDKEQYMKNLTQSQAAQAPANPGASGTASSAPSTGAPSASFAAGASSAPPAAAPVPRSDSQPPPAAPPPQNSDSAKASQEPDSPRFHLFAFEAGYFMANGAPDNGGSPDRGVFIDWTPSFRLPILSFFTLRGNLGGAFILNNSQNTGFNINEYQVFLQFTLLKPIYAEAGIGRQVWQNIGGFNQTCASLNGGFILKESGFMDRVFVGVTGLNNVNGLAEFRGGIGMSF